MTKKQNGILQWLEARSSESYEKVVSQMRLEIQRSMGKVKLEDLSVGNYVCAEIASGVSGNVQLTPPMRIVSLGEGAGGWVNLVIDQEQGDPFEYTPDEIRGVPLTGDILKENGFDLVDDADDIKFGCYELGKECYCWHKGNIWRIRSYTDLSVFCDVEYVHELQNAFRLMKIDKQFTL